MSHTPWRLLRSFALAALLCLALAGAAVAQTGNTLRIHYYNVDAAGSGTLPTFANAAYVLNGGAASVGGVLVTRMIADDLTYDIRYGNDGVGRFAWGVVNAGTTAVTARMLIRFYDSDGPSGGPGTLLGGANFNQVTINPQTATAFQTLTADAIVNDPWFFNPIPDVDPLPATTTVWAAITFDNSTTNIPQATAAELNQLGVLLNNTVLDGSSQPTLFRTTAAGDFVSDDPPGALITTADNPNNPPGALGNWIFILRSFAVIGTLQYPGAIPGDTTNFGADVVNVDWYNSSNVLVHRNRIGRNPGIVNPTTGAIAFGLFDPDPDGDTNPTTGVDPDGTADDTFVPNGTYTVVIYGRNTLRKRINNVVVNSASTTALSLGTVTLLSGDITADNTVDFADFEAFLNAFGLNFGDTGYDELADFNRDSTVDFADFEIFLNTFGLNGDPNP